MVGVNFLYVFSIVGIVYHVKKEPKILIYRKYSTTDPYWGLSRAIKAQRLAGAGLKWYCLVVCDRFSTICRVRCPEGQPKGGTPFSNFLDFTVGKSQSVLLNPYLKVWNWKLQIVWMQALPVQAGEACVFELAEEKFSDWRMQLLLQLYLWHMSGQYS